MSRVIVLFGVLLVALALGWALWERDPEPIRAPQAAVSTSAPRARETPPPASESAPLPPKRAAVVTAIEAPPRTALDPPIPEDRKGFRRLIGQQAPPPPGIGDTMNPNEAPPEPGTMRREAVREAVLQAKPVIAGCYEQTLARNPQAAGTLKVQFVLVAKDGVAHLKDAEITEDSLGDPFLGMCALKALADLEFEAEADGEVTVNYPFILKSEEEEGEETP